MLVDAGRPDYYMSYKCSPEEWEISVEQAMAVQDFDDVSQHQHKQSVLGLYYKILSESTSTDLQTSNME